jgi:hypothetical protein
MPFGKICQMVDILRHIRLTHALFLAPNFPSRQPYRIPEPVRENIQKPCLHKNFLWTFQVLFGKLSPLIEDAREIRLTHALFLAPNFPSRQPYRIPEPVRENIQKPCLHKNFLWTFQVLFGKLSPLIEDAREIRLTHALFLAPNFPSREPTQNSYCLRVTFDFSFLTRNFF